jgi:hypothetical protein
MLELPRAVRLAAWGNAVLGGLASPDEGAERITASDDLVRVEGLPGETAGVALTLAVGRLRALGVRGLRVALPAPGDAAGLPGPPAFNALAVDATQAVLTAGSSAPLGLVPSVTALGSSGTAVSWRVHEVLDGRTPSAPSLREAERSLQQALREATEELVALDVARWSPEVGPAIASLRDRSRDVDTGLAAGYPAEAHRVLMTARRVGAIVELAGRSSGAAISAGEMARRTAVIAPLARASRHAMAAACNVVFEPGGLLAG